MNIIRKKIVITTIHLLILVTIFSIPLIVTAPDQNIFLFLMVTGIALLGPLNCFLTCEYFGINGILIVSLLFLLSVSLWVIILRNDKIRPAFVFIPAFIWSGIGAALVLFSAMMGI